MASVIPATRNYFLFTMCKNVLPDETTIFFGKRLLVYTAPLTLQCIGWTALQSPAELAPNLRREEEFDLDCVLSSFAGDQDFDARESEVMTNWALVTAAVGNDGTIGGNVRWAQITEYHFTPDANAEMSQSLGELEFKLTCVQRIESKS